MMLMLIRMIDEDDDGVAWLVGCSLLVIHSVAFKGERAVSSWLPFDRTGAFVPAQSCECAREAK